MACSWFATSTKKGPFTAMFYLALEAPASLSGWKDYGMHQHMPQLETLKVRVEIPSTLKSSFEYIMT